MNNNWFLQMGNRSARWLGAVALAMAFAAPQHTMAKGPAPADGLPAIQQTDLPKHGQETYAKIKVGGPFPYEKDGVVFANRERILPAQKRGYYREYTVKTPGERTRGARRIVCGGNQPTQPDACYYTADHYSSFKRISP
jgi:ribonuclease T1